MESKPKDSPTHKPKLKPPLNEINTDNTPNEDSQKFDLELKKGVNKKEFIMNLFPKKIYAQLYFAWCKDCSENITVENAKYFRDELLLRGNKDMRNFIFRSMRVGKNFLMAFVGNLEGGRITKLDLSNNLVSDACMHNIKNIVSVKKVVHLNLASNMISTEGLKIIQNEIMGSDSLKVLNLGITEGSFRRNNFCGDGGLILARILLSNEVLTTLELQDNELGEEAGDKIGSALIQNKILSRLKVADNKIKNKGAKSILDNGDKLVSIDLSNNDITPDICLDLKKLLSHSHTIQELIWDGNHIGTKGIKYIVEGLKRTKSLKYLSLKSTYIGNQGVKILSDGLRDHKYLDTLDISSNAITYDNFTDICECLNTNKITCLKAKNNLLGDNSMEYFAQRILSDESTCNLNYFDFSSCKIYDQGLVYILNQLAKNTKITKMKLRDNYFSHEIDYVVIDFLEKNITLQMCDLNKNRFSFQCLKKINKIIERNKKRLNDKEPNRLLIDVYRLKYENTKLNDLKDTLKFWESESEKYKLGRADIRQDYESKKDLCEEETVDIKKKNNKVSDIIAMRKQELMRKEAELAKSRSENIESEESLLVRLNEAKDRKLVLEEESKNIGDTTESLEKDFIVRIETLSNTIGENKKKEKEYDGKKNEYLEEISIIDKKIKVICKTFQF